MTTIQILGTLAIAAFAVVISLMQWWTNRQKLVLDLFEKRYQVFFELRRAASEASQLGKLQEPGMMNEIIARARFIFGDDINDRLVEMHALAVKLEIGEPRAITEMNKLFDETVPLFTPYLGLKQKLPRLL